MKVDIPLKLRTRKNPTLLVFLVISDPKALFIFLIPQSYSVESPLGIIAKVLDSDLKMSKFKLQSCYYVHFWTNTLGKDMTLLTQPLGYRLNSITAVLL